MKELSLNLLDIARNSIEAGATSLTLELCETDLKLAVSITDNGSGMDEQTCRRALDPFFTTRVTRRVGLGLPLLKMRAEMTGGSFSIVSAPEEGTRISADFIKSAPDFVPLGDIASTVVSIISASPDLSLRFVHTLPDRRVLLDTDLLREKLEALPLCTPEVLCWISEYLNSQYL